MNIDFSGYLEALPEAPPLKRYSSRKNRTAVPGVELIAYCNELDPNDTYLSASSVCEVLGFGKSWFSDMWRYSATVERLVSHGFSGSRASVQVWIEGTKGRTLKPMLAIDRADFNALLFYAAEIGKAPAITLRNTLMIMGLLQVAELANEESYDMVFVNTFREISKELAGKANAS